MAATADTTQMVLDNRDELESPDAYLDCDGMIRLLHAAQHASPGCLKVDSLWHVILLADSCVVTDVARFLVLVLVVAAYGKFDTAFDDGFENDA
eukprot:gene5841-biopygen7213